MPGVLVMHGFACLCVLVVLLLLYVFCVNV